MYNQEETSRQLSAYADSKKIGEGKRMYVTGKSTMTLTPDSWQIDIYDASDTDISIVKSCQCISATGVNDSLLCVGSPLQVNQFYDDTYLVTRIIILDGDDAWRSVSNTSVSSQTSMQQVMRSVLINSHPKFRTAIGFTSSEKTTRGISFFGRTIDFLKTVADKSDMIIYSYRNTVYMQQKVSASDITLTDVDLLDAPEKMHGGCIVKIPPIGYFIGRNVVLDTKTLSGTFRLVQQSVNADNTDGDYESYLLLADERTVVV